ncbi:hypothetical protein KUTeg_017791 [Tegillarca granosa]|uniref:Uncharacterized protein n=1 Tax=Tegillarca granosa TaxID=220873 RepID=A0ABQ9EFY1_TEGGR|nr:hypothetical protein KUTeg_017791 [Tegillarca granosa]
MGPTLPCGNTDIKNINRISPQTHFKYISNKHRLLFLTKLSEVRNYFEDVLNDTMLHLVQCYQMSLGEEGEKLNGIEEFYNGLNTKSTYTSYSRTINTIILINLSRKSNTGARTGAAITYKNDKT